MEDDAHTFSLLGDFLEVLWAGQSIFSPEAGILSIVLNLLHSKVGDHEQHVY